jgi:hypothetical protein
LGQSDDYYEPPFDRDEGLTDEEIEERDSNDAADKERDDERNAELREEDARNGDGYGYEH